jgi:hypothetical protein
MSYNADRITLRCRTSRKPSSLSCRPHLSQAIVLPLPHRVHRHERLDQRCGVGKNGARGYTLLDTWGVNPPAPLAQNP